MSKIDEKVRSEKVSQDAATLFASFYRSALIRGKEDFNPVVTLPCGHVISIETSEASKELVSDWDRVRDRLGPHDLQSILVNVHNSITMTGRECVFRLDNVIVVDKMITSAFLVFVADDVRRGLQSIADRFEVDLNSAANLAFTRGVLSFFSGAQHAA